jgi:hypothetical protein
MPKIDAERTRLWSGGGGGESTKGGGGGQSVLDLQEKVGNEQTVKTVLGPDVVTKFAGVAGQGTSGPLFMTTSTYKQVAKLLSSYAAKFASRPSAWRRAEVGALDNVLEAWFSSKDSRGTSEEAKSSRSAMRWLEPKVKQELNVIDGVETPEQAPEPDPEVSGTQDVPPIVDQVKEEDEKKEDDLEKKTEAPPEVETVLETGGKRSKSKSSSASSSIANDTNSQAEKKKNSSSSSSSQQDSSDTEDPEVAKLPKVKYFKYKQLDEEYKAANEFKKGGKHLVDIYALGSKFGNDESVIATKLEESWARWKAPTVAKYWKKMVDIFGTPKKQAQQIESKDVSSVSVSDKDSSGYTRGTDTKEKLRVEYKEFKVKRLNREAEELRELKRYGIDWTQMEVSAVKKPPKKNSSETSMSSDALRAEMDQKRYAKALALMAEKTDPEAITVKAKNTDEERAKYKIKLGTQIIVPEHRKKKKGPKTQDGDGPETEPAKDVPLDTKDMMTNKSGAGFGIFVMDNTGQIYVGSHKVGLFHHSSFLAGGDVAAAGELKASNGKIVSLTDKSGHYKPEVENDLQMINELAAGGAKASSYEYRYFGEDNEPEVFTNAVEFMMAEKRLKAEEARKKKAREDAKWDKENSFF